MIASMPCLMAIERSTDRVNIYNLGADTHCEVNESIAWICEALGVRPKIEYTGGDRGWIGDNPFIFLDTKKVVHWGGSRSSRFARSGQDDRYLRANPRHSGCAPMNVGVLGLGHLGSVTAACLAKLGHRVVGMDFDEARVANLNQGIAPIFEPGLEDLLEAGDCRRAICVLRARSMTRPDIDVLWVAYDTPVDADDDADTDFVMAQIERALFGMSRDVVVLISSQLPVGSVRRLECAETLNHGTPQLKVAYSPENLRLGRAVGDFLRPERIVVGVRSSRDRELLHGLLSSITESIEWMSVESAEMTKHAVNAFLAASVAFANEIASICESVGADAKEVERGLKTENRIGPRAYLSPGAAFAGGTLARDVAYLNRTAHERGVITPLLSSVLASNDAHKRWVQRKLRGLFVDLSRTQSLCGASPTSRAPTR
jgi:UDPglucose 6-dehydrogenase